MDRSPRRLLSPLHAEALELAARGVEPSELARILDVDASAVGPLLRIARAKLATLERLDGLGSDLPESMSAAQAATNEEETT
jgi:hypothetical protein